MGRLHWLSTAACGGLIRKTVFVFTILVSGNSLAEHDAGLSPEKHNPQAHSDAVVTKNGARFTVLTDRLIRIEYQSQGAFTDAATQMVLNRYLPVPSFSQTTDSEGRLVISTDSLTLTYNPNIQGLNARNLSIEFTLNDNKVRWVPGKQDQANLLGTSRTLDGMDGGYQWDGKPLQLEQGLLSRSGWALIDDSQSLLMDDSDWQWIKPRNDAQIDWYFFGYGHDYKTALQDYTRIAGKIPLPPRYAFGYWWSRYWAYSDAELRDLMTTMRDYDIPIDVLVIDMDWHLTHGGLKDIKNPQLDPFGEMLGWTGYTWNRELFPEPEAFLDWTEGFNLKTALNLHPASGIPPMEEQYEAFAEAYNFDTSNKDYIPYRMAEKSWAQAYSDTILTPFEQQGVDFWWLDWQQFPESKIQPGLSNTWWLNHVFFTDMENKGQRPLLFHRWGGMGNHRYQIGFSGDDKISWGSLKYQTYFTPTASNVGYGYWSHDIGGHGASDLASDPELYLRWIQFGIFSPIFRTHSAKISTIERRFWMYPEYFDAMRELVQWRYRLNPYIYTAARQAHDTGVSLLRPMYYDYPDSEHAYSHQYQYMFGDDILVAPVAEPVSEESLLARKTIWLPKGQWYEWSTGTLLAGGDSPVTRAYSEQEIPLFYKAGSMIPEYEDISHLQTQYGQWSITVIPGDSGKGVFYEDNGNDTQYQHDAYATTLFTHELKDRLHEIRIEGRQGTFEGALNTRQISLSLPSTLPVSDIKINGQPIEAVKDAQWHYKAETLTNVISLPEASIDQVWEITFTHQVNERDLVDGKLGQFGRVEKAIADLKIEIARENWWATFPNRVFATLQTPTKMAYQPDQAVELLQAYPTNYQGMLEDITQHRDIRPHMAKKYLAFLGAEE